MLRRALPVTAVAALAAVLALAGCANAARNQTPFLIDPVALTPDASLVFSFVAEGTAALYRADTDGRNVRRVARPERGDYFLHPAVSPDGRTVAFVAYRGADFSRGTLHVVALAGGAPRPIDVGVRTVTGVAFSADGRHLYVLGADAYTRSRGPAGDYAHDIDLYTVGTDGRGLRRLTALDASVMEDLAVVRERGAGASGAGEPGTGERVVVKLGPEPGDGGAYVFLDPARPGLPAPVWTAHPDSFWVMTAAVSPDGRRVAFDDRNVAGWSLMDTATQQVRPIAMPGGSPATVRWTPRSDALVVCQACDEPSPVLARVDAGTGAATAIQIRLADVLAARDAAP